MMYWAVMALCVSGHPAVTGGEGVLAVPAPGSIDFCIVVAVANVLIAMASCQLRFYLIFLVAWHFHVGSYVGFGLVERDAVVVVRVCRRPRIVGVATESHVGEGRGRTFCFGGPLASLSCLPSVSALFILVGLLLIRWMASCQCV